MKRTIAFVVLIASAPPLLAAEPFVRVSLPLGASYLAGQPIDMQVEVLAPNYFMSPVHFPVLDMSGAVVSLSDDAAINFSETVDGESYSGVRRQYRIVPMQAGSLTVPRAAIEFSYAAVPGRATKASADIPERPIEVTLPAGAVGPDGPLPLARLDMAQMWDPQPVGLKVGDAITRTVSVFATGLPAMLIPPAKLPAPVGVKVYARDPVLASETRGGREFTGGRRTDRATYAFTAPGQYAFPEIEERWYDAGSGTAKSATVPGIEIQVMAASNDVAAIAPDAPASAGSGLVGFEWSRWLLRGGAALLALLAILLAASKGIAALIATVRARRQAYRMSEPALFAGVRKACRAGEPLAAYRALLDWTRVAHTGPLSTWARRFGNGLEHELNLLERQLFGKRGSSPAWDAWRLEASLVAARRSFLPTRRRRKPALPSLNPEWTARSNRDRSTTPGRSAA
jgi:hypothetical protein